jgi:PHD/YefM family antitoxin component YafN of YafNO toxin-antitoxin module
VTTKDNQSVVILFSDEYNAIKETMYLYFHQKNNRERLLDAVDEIEQMKFTKKELA